MPQGLKTVYQRYGKTLGEAATVLRSLADIIDQNPDAIYNYIDSPAITMLTNDQHITPTDRLQIYEALAYGDVGVLFAMPRTCLTGILLREIGTQSQLAYYFQHLKKHKSRSFFATTEVNRGSDANNLETKIESDVKNKDILYVTGEKMLVGNLAIADIGVVIGRVSEGPLGIRALLLTPDDFAQAPKNTIRRQSLPMIGIKAAQLGYAAFKHFPAQRANLLGEHVNPTKRGLMAVIRTFNKMRLGICGLAIGHAQSIVDYIYENKSRFKLNELKTLENFNADITVVRQLAYSASQKIDQAPHDTAHIALAKVAATALAEKIACEAFSFFGQGSFFTHPFLAKRYRDSFGFEYMDGTTDIQLNNVFHGFVNHAFRTN